MMMQQWGPGPPSQQIGKQINQTSNSRSDKFQQIQDHHQHRENFPLVFEQNELINQSNGPPCNNENFDFYDGLDGNGYLMSGGPMPKQLGGLLVSSSAMQPDLENRLPPEGSSVSSLMVDDRPSVSILFCIYVANYFP